MTVSAVAQDRFFLTEKDSKEVRKYTEAFVASGNWGASQAVSPANGAPDDLFVNNDNVYVLDASAKRVYRYAYTGGTPTVSRELRLTGSSTSVIATPYGMSVDTTQNELWIAADSMVFYKYNLATALSSGTGVNASNAYSFGTISGQTNSKVGGLALDSTYVYVLDNEDSRLYRYLRSSGAISAVSRQMRNAGGTVWAQLQGVAVQNNDVYLVNNDSANTVIRYSLSDLFTDTGTQNAAVGNTWTLPSANDDPWGIALNPLASVSSITRSGTSPTNGSSVSFTVTFTESVTGVDAADFSLTTTGAIAGASVSSVTGSGASRTVMVSTGSGSGTIRLNLVDNDTILDGASVPLGGTGVNGSFTTGEAYTLDKDAASVSAITPSTVGPTNADSVSFSISFNESVVGFDSSDVVVSHNGTGHMGVSVTGSGAAYIVTITGITGDGAFTVSIAPGSGIQDTVGNVLALGMTSAGVSIDNTAPTVLSVTPSTAGPTNSDSISFSVAFTEAVTGFDALDVQVSDSGTGHSGVSVTGSGAAYTVTVNNITNDGTFTLSAVPGAGVQDPAGNSLLSGATSAAVVVDNTPPAVVSIVAVTTGPTNAETIGFDVTFDGPVNGFAGEDDLVIVHNGTSHTTATVEGSGDTYSVTVGGVDGDGVITVALNTASDVQDEAGNTLVSTPTSEPVVVDNTSPLLVSIAPESAREIVITFTEAGAMSSNVLLPASYTARGPGLGSLTANPDSVVDLGGNTFKLTWNSGGSINGEELTVDVDPLLTDSAGNPVSSTKTSASMIAVPVSMSGFSLD